ncbi:MAG: hypothetical protein LUG14_04075 [Synergistaceae bacterium]|nr:hypothetical protein [Synergistaceae bacterium]
MAANLLSLLAIIEQPAMTGGGIFRFHMAAAGRGEHLQIGNREIFLNISKITYGERCENDKNGAVRHRGHRLPTYTFALGKP